MIDRISHLQPCGSKASLKKWLQNVHQEVQFGRLRLSRAIFRTMYSICAMSFIFSFQLRGQHGEGTNVIIAMAM